MYTAIIIFYITLLCMILMIYGKARELKTGHPTMISRIFATTDHFFHGVAFSVRRGISYINRHTFIALAQLIAYYILRHLRSWYIAVHMKIYENPHGRKVIDMVRGKGEVKNHGASAYLKRISNK